MNGQSIERCEVINAFEPLLALELCRRGLDDDGCNISLSISSALKKVMVTVWSIENNRQTLGIKHQCRKWINRRIDHYLLCKIALQNTKTSK